MAVNPMSPVTKGLNPRSEQMNVVYEALRLFSVPQLVELWDGVHEIALRDECPAAALFRYQIAFTLERKLSGRW